MTGTPVIAAWIAHGAFWCLLAFGWAAGELQIRGIAILLALWLGAYLGFPYLPYGAALFPSFVGVLDIALVLVIVKGDVRLT